MKAADDKLNHELVGRTREVWQPRLGRDFSCEEQKQILANVTGFFSILAEWSRAPAVRPANDNSGGTSNNEGERRDR